MPDLFGDQRGVAVPTAMLALAILSVVIVGFSALSSSEPTIAGNHLAVAQARALAEAGVERAVWALNNPGDAGGLPSAFTTAPAPYNGSSLVRVSAGGRAIGGFRVTVTNGPTPYERLVTSVGGVPDDTTTAPKAHQKITATLFNPQLAFRDPPAAVSVRGDVRLGGRALVDGRTDQSCGRKIGVVASGGLDVPGAGGEVRGGADDND